MNTRYESFRQQVSALLEARGWAWYDLARTIEVSTGRMSHIANSEEHLSTDVIERIAAAFGVPPEHFDLYILMSLLGLGHDYPELIDLGRDLMVARKSFRDTAAITRRRISRIQRAS